MSALACADCWWSVPQTKSSPLRSPYKMSFTLIMRQIGCVRTLDNSVHRVGPNPEHFDAYQKKYRRYLKLVALLKESEETAHG